MGPYAVLEVLFVEKNGSIFHRTAPSEDPWTQNATPWSSVITFNAAGPPKGDSTDKFAGPPPNFCSISMCFKDADLLGYKY